MACCPNCGSSSITLAKKSTVNWGRAIGGYFLFGIVGGAVGAVTGNDRDVNVCLDCGTTWKAQDLYQSLQLIEKSSGRKFDLSMSKDREYLCDFLNHLDNFNKQLEAQSKEFDQLIRKAKENTENPTAMAFSVVLGTVLALIGLVIGFLEGDIWDGVIAGATAGIFFGTFFGVFVDMWKRPERLRNVESTKLWVEEMKTKTQQEIKVSLGKIARRYQ